MSRIGEPSVSFISSILPNNTANTIISTSILTAAIALGIHHISPTRLTHVLVTLMHETDTIYIRAVEAGLVPGDVDANTLFKLQIKFSELHEESLRNSLSTWKMLAEFSGAARSSYTSVSGTFRISRRESRSLKRNSCATSIQWVPGLQRGPCLPEGGTFILRLPLPLQIQLILFVALQKHRGTCGPDQC
ncbi:hypothetical protein C8J57DRAFT_1474267 [Mycena rebaudengoi]|nr:hypothetical protein C8J57DRAFT_1474267 [Mycena rebaudengoi]